MQIDLNLIKALSHCLADEQAMLAALLHTVHFHKVYRFPFPSAEHISKLVRESASRFRGMPPDQRMRILVSEIARRLNAEAFASEEDLSRLLLWKAASKYNIETTVPPITLAREVLQRGIADLIKQYLDAYTAASPEKRRQMDAEMNEAIRSLSPELIEELRKKVGAEKLTSDALRRFMQHMAEGGALFAFIQSLGFSAYIALSTIIHTVFTTILGITLPFGVYMTSSWLFSQLTGPVGWAVWGVIVTAMLVKKGRHLNQEMLSMVALTALLQWWQQARTQEGDEQANELVSTEEPLPVPLHEWAAELRSLKASYQTAAGALAQTRREIERARDNMREEQKRTTLAIQKARESQQVVQNLQIEYERAVDALTRLRHSADRTTPEPSAEIQLMRAKDRIQKLQKDLHAAILLAEEAEQKMIEAQNRLRKSQQEATSQIKVLEQQLAEKEQNVQNLWKQLEALRAKRKNDWQRRFERLMVNLRFHDKALQWFVEQADQNLVLSAEKILLDLNYSGYPPGGWKRIAGTRFEEIHFAKDYRIYFEVSGNLKTIWIIGHKNTQTQDIQWLSLQRAG